MSQEMTTARLLQVRALHGAAHASHSEARPCLLAWPRRRRSVSSCWLLTTASQMLPPVVDASTESSAQHDSAAQSVPRQEQHAVRPWSRPVFTTGMLLLLLSIFHCQQ